MEKVQLSKLLDTHNHNKTLDEIKSLYGNYYSEFETIENLFFNVKDLFDGNFPGYQKCNTQYHDFQHSSNAAVRWI